MQHSINRRRLLGAVPAVALGGALVSRVSGCTAPTNNAGWHKVTATWRTASDRLDRAFAADSAADEAVIRCCKSAPETTITYEAEALHRGPLTVAARQSEHHMTIHNFDGAHLPAGVKSHPEYQAFGEAVAAWERET